MSKGDTIPRQEYKLYPHQKEGIRFMLEHNYCILGDGMG
jgi:hypothetical protein